MYLLLSGTNRADTRKPARLAASFVTLDVVARRVIPSIAL
jgi:hypothetical protein